jgi:hypothetical protein
VYLKYITISNILNIIRQASISCTLIKRDIADAFYNIPLALYITWLLGFLIRQEVLQGMLFAF